jgi:hypothetical protein
MDNALDLFDDESADQERPWARKHKLNTSTGKKTIESTPAFAAFRAYCIMGSKRSLRLVARGLGKSQQLLSRWSVAWSWQERVRAYDDFAAVEETAAFIQERRSMARRQAQLGVLGQNIAATSLLAIQEQLKVAGQQRPLKVHEVMRLLDVSAKLERISRGENDEDQVAQIIVHIEKRQQPRYMDPDAEEKFGA